MQNNTNNFVSNSTDTHAISLDIRSFGKYKPSFRFHNSYVVGHYLIVEIEFSELEKVFAVVPSHVRTNWDTKDFIKALATARTTAAAAV